MLGFARSAPTYTKLYSRRLALNAMKPNTHTQLTLNLLREKTNNQYFQNLNCDPTNKVLACFLKIFDLMEIQIIHGVGSMFALNKLTLALIVTSSSTVFAGAMGPVCTPGNVTIPCEHSAWSVGAQALYLRPSLGTEYFPLTSQQNFLVFNGVYNSDSETIGNGLNNPWGWGFKLEGNYYFNSGNDIDLNWYHLDHTTNKKYNTGVLTLTGTDEFGSGSYNYFYDLLTNSQFNSNVYSNINTQWDAVNLELGQHMDFSSLKNIRFHGGFQYAKVQTRNTNTATSPSSSSSLNQIGANGSRVDLISSTSELKYIAFGPRIGTDLFYSWNRFSVYANAAAALLVGTRKFDTTVVGATNAAANGVPLGTPYLALFSSSTTAIVPELEAKTGVNYTYAMAQSSLILDAGWMWVNYFNAQQTTNDTMDFGVQGPYAGLKWIGNIA
jgi:hypothetical protein